MLAIFAIFYFLLIRPQQQSAKREGRFPQPLEERRRSDRRRRPLRPGRRHDATASSSLEIAPNVRVRVDRRTIEPLAAVRPAKAEEKERAQDMTAISSIGALLVVAADAGGSGLPVPSMVIALPAWWKSRAPDQPIRLGLDLQGGMHLVLEVQIEKALEFSVDRIGRRSQARAAERARVDCRRHARRQPIAEDRPRRRREGRATSRRHEGALPDPVSA